MTKNQYPLPKSAADPQPSDLPYPDQVRQRNGRWQIACVECGANQTGPAWRNVAIRAWATWIFHQAHGRNKTIEGGWHDPEYLCGVCGADVGYMLNDKIKGQLQEDYLV